MLWRVMQCVRNEEGIETLEWIAMGAVILAVLFLAYPGTLGDTINTVMGAVQTKLDT